MTVSVQSLMDYNKSPICFGKIYIEELNIIQCLMEKKRFKSRSVEKGLNVYHLNQKAHLKSHGILVFCLEVLSAEALLFPIFAKSAMSLAFEFGSSAIEHHLSSKELCI